MKLQESCGLDSKKSQLKTDLLSRLSKDVNPNARLETTKYKLDLY